MVEIYHAYKLLETLESDRLLELPDGLHLVRQGSSTMLSDAVSKEVYFGTAELALGDIDYKAIIMKALKQLSQVGLVLCWSPGCRLHTRRQNLDPDRLCP